MHRLFPYPCVLALLLTASLVLVGCRDDPTAPPGPPYLAVVARVTAPPGIATGERYTYRIRELSGTLGIDMTIRATPIDTIIVPVPAATYVVEISDVPAICGIRDGRFRSEVILPGTNTTVVRYGIDCRSPLTIVTSSDGFAVDSQLVVGVAPAGAGERALLIGASDSLRLDGLAPGDYVISLRHLAPNCTVTSDGGTLQHAAVSETGGTIVTFRISCADEQRRPRIVSFHATAQPDGSTAFVAHAVDPDRDIERYIWNLTDCRGTSILPNGPRMRGGLSRNGRTANRDSIIVLAAFETGLSDAHLHGRCAALWVADEYGYASSIVERPLLLTADGAPHADAFNAQRVGTTAIRTTLAASDPDDDYVGVYVVYEVRDGVFRSPPDGEVDRVIFHVVGHLGTAIPDVILGGTNGVWDDYFGVIAYLVDGTGRFTRVADRELGR